MTLPRHSSSNGVQAVRAGAAWVMIAGCVDGGADSGTGTDFAVGTAGMDTVLIARWTTEAPTTGTVHASFGDEVLSFPESEAGTTHEVLLIGVPAATAATVTLEQGGEELASVDVQTGALPAWVPEMTYTTGTTGFEGVTLVPIVPDGGGGVVAVDGKGRVVWSYPPTHSASELIVRARLSLDGRHVLYNTPADSADAPGAVHRVALLDSSRDTIELTGGHLDFVEPTPGGYATLGWDLRELEGRRFAGDHIVERDPDGTERIVWSVWDWFEPDLERTWPPQYLADPEVEDWSHINGLAYAPDEDAYYVTMTFNDGVARIDRATGALTWVLANSDSDFVWGDDRLVQQPHGVQRLDDGGLLVFNRGYYGDPGSHSEAVEITLDETAWTADRRWSYADPGGIKVLFLGSAQRLDSGNTLISWSSGGQLDEVTPEGELAARLSTAIGAAVGFCVRVEGLGG